jgi:hypothetical protein
MGVLRRGSYIDNTNILDMKSIKLIITDKGDPSVGIFPMSWTIECPFLSDMDLEGRDWFREQIIKAYSEFIEGRIIAEYEDETFD